jgi:NAD(P)-dependent dehydrogenase (short-subunit alcohol dehydrogenase family)
MTKQTALIVGASRGLGWGLAREYLQRGWNVIATVRDEAQHTRLHDLLETWGGALRIEQVDINVPQQVDALHGRLAAHTFDLLFVNAGVANDPEQIAAEASDAEFIRVMLTNTLSPLRFIERFVDRVTPRGQVAAMSSELGSVAENVDGGWEIYRGSKAALNTLLRSLVARRPNDARTFYAVAPGWVRTEMGGDAAPLDIDTSIAGVADALDARKGARGLVFVNYRNEILPW